MTIVVGFLGMGVDQYSPSSWSYVQNTIYPWFLSMGSTLLNLFCLIGFCRQASNLKDNVTTEMWIELFIKVLIANILMVNGLGIMQEFTGFASRISGTVIGDSYPQIIGDDLDLGLTLTMSLVAPLYLILTLVCGITILIEVMGRFLNLYMLMSVAPLALSTAAGGRGMENSAISWFKSFLTNVLQIAVIALILQFCSKIISENSLTIMANSNTLTSWFSGAGSLIYSFVIMPFMATAVKESDNFLKRAFDLR